VSATGTATAFGRDTSAGGNRSANVTIRDNATITLGVCNLGGGQAGGNVTLTIQNNAVLSCGGNLFDLQNVNRSTAITTVRLNGGTFLVGGFSKTKTSQTNVINFNGGVLKAGAATASFLPPFSISINYVQSGGAKIDDGGNAIAIAAPLIHDPGLGATLDGGLVKLGTGILTLTAPNGYTGPTTVSNGALVIKGTNGPSAVNVSSGATLRGSGVIGGPVTINSNGALEPGSTLLTISNNLIVANGARLKFTLGTVGDKVAVSGNITLGGALYVTAAGGFTNNTYTLFTYTGSLSGSIPTIASMPPGYVGFVSTNIPGQVNLVVQYPPPAIGTVAQANGSLVITGNGPTNLPFYVLTSTNILLPRAQWTRIATNQFDATGSFSFTNPIDPSLTNAFFELQLP
jgi:fibronectin-binding autotransporter adhesin